MLGTMMTVFVRLHHSYKPGVNSGDVGYNDDSICKIALLITHIHRGVNSSDVGHNDDTMMTVFVRLHYS